MSDKIVVAALFKFVTLSDYTALREPLLQVLLDNGIKGTLLLAEEGIRSRPLDFSATIKEIRGSVNDAQRSEASERRADRRPAIP